MSQKLRQLTPKWPALVSLALVLTACGGTTTPTSSSSSSNSSSAQPVSSSSVSSISSSASSLPAIPDERPNGPPVVQGRENASGQTPAFSEQTDADGAKSSFTVKTQTVTSNLRSPWAVEFLPDGRLIVNEKGGTMRIVTREGSVGSPISGVPSVFSADQAGLMDLAVSPNFEEDRMLYFTFVETRDGGQATTVAKARLADDDSRLENLTILLRQTPSWKNIAVGFPSPLFTINGHFGSRLAFDFNGNLFMTVGERYNEEIRGNAQVLDNYIGKLIHITTNGDATLDNPFVNQGSTKPEIWSYGHRNVQAVDIHPLTGEVWTVEHGPQGGDEINKPEPGSNYGWPVITYGRNYDFWGGTNNPIGENKTAKDGMEQPRYYWDPVIAPSGARFYLGDMFPEWNYNLLITGLAPGDLTRIILDGDKVIGEERLLASLGRLRDLAIADDGSIWIVTDGTSGKLIRVYR